MVKTLAQLTKGNTGLIQRNYEYATEIHKLRHEIMQLKDVVHMQGQKITALEALVTSLKAHLSRLHTLKDGGL